MTTRSARRIGKAVPRKEWRSNARWPLSVYRGMDGTGITSDDHYTYEEALMICHALQREGFGGLRADYPLEVWVSELEFV